MSALSELLLEDRDEEQGASCALDSSADEEATKATTAEKQAPPSPSGEEQEKKRRAEHEANEAARKAEFEEKQRRKKEEKERARQIVRDMSDADATAAAVKRIEEEENKLRKEFGADSNGLVQVAILRTLKAGCQCDADFARSILNPDKSLENCFRYVGTQAYEMKKDAIRKQLRNGAQYAVFDFPPKLCFQWAANYFRDLNAAEDKKPEEKFKPQPYRPTTPKAAPPKPEEKKPKEETTQLSLF